MLLDAAHLRAEVRRLEPNGDAFGLDERDERVGDLLTEPLLDGEPPRKEPDEPGQLGDADDPLARDVPDVRVAVEGQRVVLAERGERDRPLDDLGERLAPGGVASVGNVVTSLGSPSYPDVASKSARRKRSGVSRVPGVPSGSPSASRISAMLPRYLAQSSGAISRGSDSDGAAGLSSTTVSDM